MSEPAPQTSGVSATAEGRPSEGQALAQSLANVGQTTEDLARLDKRSCPVCGITFFEFRNQGRLGCPHDYVCFQKELAPLVMNIHGESEHVGKRPKRSAMNSDLQTELIRLRREMKEAIRGETRTPPQAHGSSDMPVWGPIFRDLDRRKEVNDARIENLVKYIESIQAKVKAD